MLYKTSVSLETRLAWSIIIKVLQWCTYKREINRAAVKCDREKNARRRLKGDFLSFKQDHIYRLAFLGKTL